ncbi:MAG: formate dehydrogenase accessory sulfurtransferase FdhD [Actinomycetota bacterium]
MIPGAPVRRPSTTVQVVSFDAAGTRRRSDVVVTEEPLEIRLHGPAGEPTPLVVTMRTPGHDFELAAGFLFAEGIVREPDRIARIAYCLGGEGEQQYNVVTVRLRGAPLRLPARALVATSACGLCGKATLDDVADRCDPVGTGPRVAAATIAALPERLRAAQAVFGRTGGLHAAARFTPAGELISLREDVGRHNALDKLVGEAFLAGALPLADEVLMVSGRCSFELVQKAAAAGFTIMAAVSAPSSLAVAAAERFGLTLVGFVRDDRGNVYTRPERIVTDAP